MDLALLLIFLLPGFWSLWVFQRITREQIENRPDRTLFVLGLCFGLCNLLLTYALASLITHLTMIPFFPEITSFSSGEGFGSIFQLFETWEFWRTFLLLTVVSLIMGAVAGACRAKDIWPVVWVAHLGAKLVDRIPTQMDYETALSTVLENELNAASIIRISSLTCSECRVVGLFNGSSNSEDHILLKDVNLFSPDEFPYGFDFSACADLSKGVLVEYLTCPSDLQQKLVEDLRRNVARIKS